MAGSLIPKNTVIEINTKYSALPIVDCIYKCRVLYGDTFSAEISKKYKFVLSEKGDKM